MTKSIAGILAACLSLAAVTASHAEGTAAQRAACTPDVFRLCSSEIPDVTKIKACLRRERQNLSGACQSVFNELDRPASPRTVASAARS
jgi:hypothetical protein